MMGNIWRVSIGRGNESLSAQLLFNTAVLANRLRAAGVDAQSVTLKDEVCFIKTAATSKRTALEGEKICSVLKQYHPIYDRGARIHWEWDIRQYS